MTTSSTATADPLAVLALTLVCVRSAEIIHLCRNLMDGIHVEPDDRVLAREVHFDARVQLAEAREALVDMGADVQRATAAILGLDAL